MRKKFVMAVAAVAMAAVMSVSAFAADGVTVASITGNDGTTFVTPSSASASEETKKAYEAIATTKGTTEEKLAAALVSTSAESSAEQAAAILNDAATVVGAETVADVTIRTVGDVIVSENNTATLSVAGIKDGEAVVVVYLDENGNWQTMKVIARNGQLVFRLSKSTTVMVLTKKAA